MTKKMKIEYSKDTHERNNMDVIVVKFPDESVKKILDNVKLSKEQQTQALDKILDSNPNYLELPPEEQNGLIVTTLTLETILLWLMNTGDVDANATMYQAYLEGETTAVIELFYIKNKNNNKIINDAFKRKSEGTRITPLPQNKKSNKKGKGKGKVIPFNKEVKDD